LAPLDQILDLGPGHGVAFDGSRVVNVVDPDLAQDVVGLDSARQAAEVGVEELDLLVEAGQNLLEEGAPSGFPTIVGHVIRIAAYLSLRSA
jgi:hypothetical protein